MQPQQQFSNGTLGRLERLEDRVDVVSGKVDGLTGYLSGVNGQPGALQGIATDIQTLSNEFHSMRSDVRNEMVGIVRDELTKRRLAVIGLSARSVWLGAGFLIALASAIVGIVSLIHH